MLRLKSVGLIVMTMLCLLALPVMAQEAAATTAAASSSSNISTLIILFGLGMIVVVGGVMYKNANAENNKKAE